MPLLHTPEDWRNLLALYAGRLLLALVIFGGFAVAGIIADRLLHRLARRDSHRADLYQMLGGASKAGLIGFGVVSGLGTLGVDITAVVAGLGLMGVALGFALKDAVSNVAAGAMLIAYRPFTRGDFIQVTGISGRVVEVDLRYTRIRGGDTDTLVPNQTILANTVTVAHDPDHPPAAPPPPPPPTIILAPAPGAPPVTVGVQETAKG